jgi:transposase-like protein
MPNCEVNAAVVLVLGFYYWEQIGTKIARNSYTDETKAAVMAALLEGQSVSSVAKEYDISKVTVSNWKKAVAEGIHEDRT